MDRKKLLFLAVLISLFFTALFSLKLSFKGYSKTSAELEAVITSGDFDWEASEAYFLGRSIKPLSRPVSYAWEKSAVLGDLTGADDSKWIEIDLTSQKLRA